MEEYGPYYMGLGKFSNQILLNSADFSFSNPSAESEHVPSWNI